MTEPDSAPSSMVLTAPATPAGDRDALGVAQTARGSITPARRFPWRGGLLAASVAGLLVVGWLGLPRVVEATAWISAQDNPAALAELGLRAELSADRLQRELEAALAADDVDLAASFLALADQQGLTVAPALRERHREATTTAAALRRGARDFVDGARTGASESGAGLAGVVATDLTGVGDIRDLIAQGRKLARGDEPDQLVLGLAVAGLAITGATIASFGAGMPARTGASTLKAAAKSGRLSKPLAAHVGRLVGEAVDLNAVKAAAAAAARLDVTGALAAARQSLRPAALTGLRNAAEDVATISRRAGVRGTQDALALARDSGELRRVARLADTRGVSTRAILKTLGRGAIVIGSGLAVFASWMMAAVGYAWFAVLIILAIAKRLFRMTAAVFKLRRTLNSAGTEATGKLMKAAIALGFLGAVVTTSIGLSETRPPRPPVDRTPPPAERENMQRGAHTPIVRGTLRNHEAARRGPLYGHTIERHVQKTPDDLRARLRRESHLEEASAFENQVAAERLVGETLRRNNAEVAAWVGDKTNSEPKVVRSKFDEKTGITVPRATMKEEDVQGVRVVLRKNEKEPDGYHVQTAFPER